MRRMRRAVVEGLAVAGVAAAVGCTWPIESADPAAAIKRYYATHASEASGACPQPQIASIVARETLQSEGARTIWKVRYSWFDPSVDEASNWPYLLTAERACTGFGEREVTLLRRRTGYVVLDMTGERRQSNERGPVPDPGGRAERQPG